MSALSYVEVLGYHQLTEQEPLYFEDFFRASLVLPISQAVLDRAVALRPIIKMTLGDAIIAGNALVYNLNLVTRSG